MMNIQAAPTASKDSTALVVCGENNNGSLLAVYVVGVIGWGVGGWRMQNPT